MEKLGITHLIQGTLCHGQTGTGKGETIKKLMADHGIRSACYIGDIQGDLEAAEQAGVPFIHCAYGFGTADHCWRSIQSFEELLTLPNAE